MRAPGTAVLGLALCLLGAAFGQAALLVPGIALALVAGAALTVTALAAGGLSVEREPARAVSEEGAPVQLRLTLSRRRLPLGSVELAAWPGGPVARMRLRGSASAEFAARLDRRGRRLIDASTVTVGDPFGLCLRTASSAPTEVLVLPRVTHVPQSCIALLSSGGVRGRPRDSAPVGGGRLVPYRPGVPASWIHWPAVARTGTLLEREPAAEVSGTPMIVLDAREPESEQALDAAVRATASLARGLAEAGGCRVLLPGDAQPRVLGPDLRVWAKLHVRLALLAPGAAAPAVRRHAAAGPVVWVSASHPSSAPARGAARALASFIVSPLAAAGSGLFEVSGCVVQAVGPRRRRGPRGYARAA